MSHAEAKGEEDCGCSVSPEVLEQMMEGGGSANDSDQDSDDSARDDDEHIIAKYRRQQEREKRNIIRQTASHLKSRERGGVDEEESMHRQFIHLLEDVARHPTQWREYVAPLLKFARANVEPASVPAGAPKTEVEMAAALTQVREALRS